MSRVSTNARCRSVFTRIFIFLIYLLIGKATFAILFSYGDYFPPNFRADFLLGRSEYFFGAYRWAFYAHIISGPVTLIVGLLLMNDAFRRRWTNWHRRLGRAQVLIILFVLTPSGLWMSRHAITGAIAGVGFATLAVATALFAALGWRSAAQRRFEQHRSWMTRCFLLLCSAVVLRVIGGLSDLFGIGSTYPVAAWASWLTPLAVFECYEKIRRNRRIYRGVRRHPH